MEKQSKDSADGNRDGREKQQVGEPAEFANTVGERSDIDLGFAADSRQEGSGEAGNPRKAVRQFPVAQSLQGDVAAVAVRDYEVACVRIIAQQIPKVVPETQGGGMPILMRIVVASEPLAFPNESVKLHFFFGGRS